jgi:hypothetical protein
MDLWITGDPIQDIWCTGYVDKNNKWHTDPASTIYRPGGAMNTAANATAISNGDVWTEEFLPEDIPALIRMYNKLSDKTTIMWDHFGPPETMNDPADEIDSLSHKKGLIISDYNKGTVNRPPVTPLSVLQFVVVDSKYRSLHLDWLSSAKTKIWHCTGKEYDDTWGDNFDYVIHTDGPNNVVVLNDKLQQAEEIPVPDTKAVDTVGAGDTLTAAVGIWLAYIVEKNIEVDYTITFQDIVDATSFAIWCCQDVITKKHTAECTRTLQQYLEK